MTETLPWNMSVTANGVIIEGWTPYGLPLSSSSSSLSSLSSTSSGSECVQDGADELVSPCPKCSAHAMPSKTVNAVHKETQTEPVLES